jgi:hypothetical protein
MSKKIPGLYFRKEFPIDGKKSPHREGKDGGKISRVDIQFILN